MPWNASASRSRRASRTPPAPAEYDDALEPGPWRARSDADARGPRGHRGPRPAAPGLDRSRSTSPRIRAPAAVALGHVVDSLAGRARSLRERGIERVPRSGVGRRLPGHPAWRRRSRRRRTPGCLVEPVGKKARFLTTVVDAVGLDGRIHVDARRAEDVAADGRHRGRWQVVTARAVASTADLVELAFPLLAHGGALVAWKRGDLVGELARGATGDRCPRWRPASRSGTWP